MYTGPVLTAYQWLNLGTVPMFKKLKAGTVPTFRNFNVGTVPKFKKLNIGTVPSFKKLNRGTLKNHFFFILGPKKGRDGGKGGRWEESVGEGWRVELSHSCLLPAYLR